MPRSARSTRGRRTCSCRRSRRRSSSERRLSDHRATREAAPPDAQAEEQRRWEERRSGGRASFIWRYGVLGWGLPAALLTIAYGVIKEHGLAWRAVEAPFSFRLRVGIAVAVVLFPALGHLLGRRLWDAGEARYRKQLRR